MKKYKILKHSDIFHRKKNDSFKMGVEVQNSQIALSLFWLVKVIMYLNALFKKVVPFIVFIIKAI